MTERIAPREYDPDYAVPPGATIREEMEFRSISEIPYIDADDLEKLFEGRLHITPHIAQLLEAALDVPADFWLRLEANYRRQLAKLPAINEETTRKFLADMRDGRYRDIHDFVDDDRRPPPKPMSAMGNMFTRECENEDCMCENGARITEQLPEPSEPSGPCVLCGGLTHWKRLTCGENEDAG